MQMLGKTNLIYNRMIRLFLRYRYCNHLTHQMHCKHFIHSDTATQTTPTSKPTSYPSSLLLTLMLGGLAGYLYSKRDRPATVAVATNIHTQQSFTPGELTSGKKLSKQERNFAENASYMCQGILYISPADFLTVVTKTQEDLPETRSSITKVKLKEASKWLSVTSPRRSSNHDRFLRDVWSRGFLSYPDYRFLLSTLVKSKNHFKVAFSIFDRDGSGDIELNEFVQVQNSMLGHVPDILDPRGSQLSSSLLTHLFGRDGEGKLSFEEFSKFIDAFQKEVLYFEFNKYAKGNRTISSEDFAHLILRYNNLPSKLIQTRLRQRFGENIGSQPEFEFSQYDQFNTLLLNLEDFSTLLSIYTVPGKGVKKIEFNQAVQISCGDKFDPDLLDILYVLFDKDRDGFLSYEEFLDTVARRRKRGAAVSKDKWERYKSCVRNKVRVQSRVV